MIKQFVVFGLLIGMLFLVDNYQMAYGGDEGLFYTAMNDLKEKDIIKFNGHLMIENQYISSPSGMSFYVEGYLGNHFENIEMNIYIDNNGYTMDTPIASYVCNNGVHEMSFGVDDSATVIPLEGFDISMNEIFFDKEDMKEIYTNFEVSKVHIQDTRTGYRHLEIQASCYEYTPSFNIATAIDVTKIDPSLLSVLQNMIVKIYIDGNANVLRVDCEATDESKSKLSASVVIE